MSDEQRTAQGQVWTFSDIQVYAWNNCRKYGTKNLAMQEGMRHIADHYAALLAERDAELAQLRAQLAANDEWQREALAEYAHDAWAGWMKYLFEKGEFRTVNKDDGTPTKIWVMPDWAADRWQRQMLTPYADLPENEKESDRKEADEMLAIMRRKPSEVTP